MCGPFDDDNVVVPSFTGLFMATTVRETETKSRKETKRNENKTKRTSPEKPSTERSRRTPLPFRNGIVNYRYSYRPSSWQRSQRRRRRRRRRRRSRSLTALGRRPGAASGAAGVDDVVVDDVIVRDVTADDDAVVRAAARGHGRHQNGEPRQTVRREFARGPVGILHQVTSAPANGRLALAWLRPSRRLESRDAVVVVRGLFAAGGRGLSHQPPAVGQSACRLQGRN